MATNKTYSDWFKRGGQRPVDDRLPPPPEEIEIPDEDEDEDEDENDEDDGELREFDVELWRTKHVYQTCTVRVRARCEDEAADKAIDAAPEDDASWKTSGDPDFDDLEADDVCEVF